MNKELNRLEYMILQSLYRNNCNDSYNGMTIAEIMEDNDNVLGVRMTVWRKMKKLVETGYVAKGILDDHSDTFYLLVPSTQIRSLFQISFFMLILDRLSFA